jgi:hypothetical protein
VADAIGISLHQQPGDQHRLILGGNPGSALSGL